MSRQVAGHRVEVVGHRTRRAVVVAVVAGVATAVTATSAAAGGWWSTPQLEHRTLAIGESTTVSAGIMFPSTEAAEGAAGSGEFFAYLVRGIDEAGLHDAMSRSGPDDDWWTTPSEAIELGRLTLGGNSSNLGNTTARFVVPDVEPGIYDVMLCDRGCSRALADVVPLRDVYVGDPATVRLLRETGLETQHLVDELGTVRSQLERLEGDTRTLSDDVDALGQRFDEGLEGLTTSGHQVTAALATLETRSAGVEPAVVQPWWTPLGWFVAGAAVAVAWARRRRSLAMDVPGDDRGHADDGHAMTASIDVEGAHSPRPELVTWEQDRGTPVR